MADADPHAALEGVPDLLAVQMTGHLGRHLLGIAHHAPVGKDDRDPRVDMPGGFLAQPVDGRFVQRVDQADGLFFQHPAVELKLHPGTVQVKLAGKAHPCTNSRQTGIIR